MHAAALAVYAERGWYGFSLEAAARSAGVGQSAVYRRWSNKAELLAEAISAGEPEMPPMDTGSTRDDLLLLAGYYLDSYRQSVGVVGLRMVLDARSWPELGEQFAQMLRGRNASAARAVVRRCLERGDVRAGVTTAFVLEAVSGTTLSHVLYAPLATPQAGADDEVFLQRLVDSLLA